MGDTKKQDREERKNRKRQVELEKKLCSDQEDVKQSWRV